MGLQKYRVDIEGSVQADGGQPCYTRWMGGPSLALIRKCRIQNRDWPARTVYIRGEADTYFTLPAACRVKGKNVTGYVTTDDVGNHVFRAHQGQ